MTGWWNSLKSSWHRSMALLWIMVIGFQWLSYTEPIWMEQTTAAVLLSLAAVAILEILLPVHWLYRLALELAAVLYIVFRTIDHYGLYIPYPDATLGDRAADLAGQMSPYVWFALGGAGLLLAASFLITNKRRILLFIAANITAFATLDSFTPSVLWQEVAWTVFAAMGWLVTDHLKNFQRRYPRGWRYMLDYPFKILLNVAIIFSLVILTGVNMPEVRPTLTDPYTAWVEWRGTAGASQDKSSPTSEAGTGGMGSQTSSSGYSLDNTKLGGGFAFDYSPIMTVTTDQRIYMRAESRSVYSGEGWTDDDRVRRGPLEKVAIGETLENDYQGTVETKELRYTVKMLNDNDYPALFGAYAVSSVESVDGAENGKGLFWRSRDGELMFGTDGTKGYPKSYVLTSRLPVIPVEELRQQTYEELYGNPNDYARYLQLPEDFPNRVKKLARDVTQGAQTPYEKTALLQQYLSTAFPYTNTPSDDKKRSKDFVYSFLFEIKEGYCDYYSTALVTMARSLDIPARWVIGYAPGEQGMIPDNIAMQSRAANNNYTVTNADAHSWAEVYFGDYGWIPVEATPGFNVPLLTRDELPDQELPEEEEQAEPVEEQAAPAAQGGAEDVRIGPWIVGGALAVLVLWGGFLLWRYRMLLRFLVPRLRNGGALTPEQKIVAETERWVRYVRRRGLSREEHETLRESVLRWSRERPESSSGLFTLLAWFEKAKYSPDIIQDKDWHNVYTEALRLREQMKATR